MKDALINIQILYEIAMSIGTSLDMRTMLQKSLSTYLRKFSCASGAILTGKTMKDMIRLELLFAIPRTIENNSVFQAAMEQVPRQLHVDELAAHLKELPYEGNHDSHHFHIMELPGFGLLLLFKHGSPLDPFLIKSLTPLNAKLATACQNCLRKERIETIAKDLKNENRERQKVEKALAASHKELEDILDSLAAVVYVADLETHEIIFNNRYMADIYGKDSVGKTCYNLMRGESQPCPECQNHQLLDDNGFPAGTVIWEGYNAKYARHFVNHGRAIPWRDGRLVRLQISTDVTRIKQLEQERLEAAQLEQMQRLESLGTLAGGIAHEFNNLLMGMMGCVSLMKFDVKKNHPLHLNLNRIESNIRTAAGLTDKLLGYAQKGRYENRKIQVNTVLGKLIEPLSKTNVAIKIDMDLEENLNRIQADPHQIELALLNLLTNACDAMPSGGDLMVRTANDSPDVTMRSHDRPQAGSYIRVIIQDSGVGMTEETREKAFEPFFTTKSIGRGAGLGMAATYGIVKGHKGHIELESEQGRGTRITVYLPAVPETEASREIASTSKTADTRNTKTILLVDDESIVREIGEDMLSHIGHKVITAESGPEAVDIFRQQHESIDLIILDVMMPDMTGEQAYDQIKAIDNKVKVLVSSGFSIEDQAQNILAKGAGGFMQKPFSLEELKSKIGKIFEKSNN